MKRRLPEGTLDGVAPPPELVTFTEARWPGCTPAERFDAFCQARRDHFERHGWPGGSHAEIASQPDEPWDGTMI